MGGRRDEGCLLMIQFTDKGLYCPAGDFYIDPWKPVQHSIITHAHSDHAKFGNAHYLCHHKTLPILKQRLGDISADSIEWNETTTRNGVKISLHPAGHIIGSSQVRLELNGEVWVFSGDYKLEDDGISGVFEPVRCHTFITESTFGLPIYNWKSQETLFSEIQQWIADAHAKEKTPVITAYSLGKAQRVLKCIAEVCDNLWAHGAVFNTHQALVQSGLELPELKRVMPDTAKENFKNAVIIAPPSADGTPWMKKFSPYSVGVCSGWMQVRGNVRRRNADAGFALSDHADWQGLLDAVKATEAEKVFVTHGFQSVFSRYLTEIGIEAAEVKTEYGTEDDEKIPDTEEQPVKDTEEE
jgi:putative mRNA 3-end processing factor